MDETSAPEPGSGLTPTQWGLVAGLVLGVVAAFGGFVAFIIVAAFAGVGLIVGRILEGKLDVKALLGRASERR